ncbi:SgcJ/EcaC family oxidoreductase [Nonomuraea sp. FMUSA5-5]|uniref:SgcJ/EcaC family oxidoreductase n=1 Tax=Nonomuraea composti TaxID=2720023 RepID=A0ABX1BEI3_9ACTN|nr:SgcJ/EcaC family oxidoreductase [Nonomuraea sp. FMUSA5-5]NJP93726.1 SgcJ/EcaC family oxidoreductase [Nonomuraea sp. FMUSA5-5]
MAGSTDIAAIRSLVAEAEKHQNDVEPFIALHTADTAIVNIAGRRVAGKEALTKVMKAALESPLADVITRTEVADIRFVRPDVAIVTSMKRVFDGRDPEVRRDPRAALPAESGWLTYVAVREEDGAWRIASAQTTPIRA